MSKYEEALALIIKIEDKYDSVGKCPETDTDLQKVRFLLGEDGNHSKSKKLNPNERKRIIAYIADGYSPNRIAKFVKCSDVVVKNVANEEGMFFKPTFNYKIEKDGEPSYFFGKLKDLTPIFSETKTSTKFGTVSSAKIYLHRLGWKLTRGKRYWKSIADGDYYKSSQHEQFYQKNGEDSFKFE